MIIYKIENKINGKVYIGQTKHALRERIAAHIRNNKHCIGKALNKYGIDSFVISVIDHAYSRESLSEKERYWIIFYNSKVPNGYNITNGGEGHACAHSLEEIQKIRDAMARPEVRQKIREKRKLQIISEETKRKLRERIPWNKGLRGAQSPPWNKGLTKETDPRLQNVSQILQGHGFSEETILKMSIAKIGKPSAKKGKCYASI